MSVEEYRARRERLGFSMKVPLVRADPVPDLAEMTKKIAAMEAALSDLCEQIAQSKTGAFSAHRIACAVAKAHGLRFSEMIADRRRRDLVLARQHAMWEIHKHTTLSLPAIARILGKRDHTTILHGIRQHQKRIDSGEVLSVA